MGKYLVTKQSAFLLFLAFLLAAALVGLLCGLLPTCDIEQVPAVPTQEYVKQPWEYIRLPGTVSPVSYDIKVLTDFDLSTFSGSVSVLVDCLEPTELILIHSKNLQITEGETSLTREDGGGAAPGLAKEPWLYEESQFLVIELGGKLEVGARYRLYIEFQGPLRNDLLGYYRMTYTTSAGEEKYLASTFFDPVDARKAFPCFDEPALKATFNITLTHREQYHALANMPEKQKENIGDGWVRTTFEESVIMPTYLVCYVVSEFEERYKFTQNGIRFGVWAQKDFIDQVDYARDSGAAILDYFDTLYGSVNKYPLPKMDMIALPDFTAGAMENWGLITYRESALLYKEGISSESQKRRVCTIIAHELAHQWFGNLVTMNWWSYLWLNEGFASYVEYIGTVKVEPDWGMWDQFIVLDLHRAMATDALVTSRPVVTEVSTPSEINSMFDRISYQKGSSLLRMMDHFLGTATFTKGLQNYVEALQYSTAENSDLWFHLNAAVEDDGVDLGGLDIETIMKTWMRQMGFPFVTVTRDYSDSGQISAQVKQERFLSDPNSNTETDYPDLGYVWYVPVTYTTASNPDFDSPQNMWLRPNDEYRTVTVPGGSNDEWLLVNIKQRGMYRVNYDDRNWEMLKEQLRTQHTAIPTASRGALISDVFSLAMAGHISHSTALDITSYLKEERDYVPWYALDSVLGTIERNLQRKGAFGNFQKYMRDQVTPMYDYIGWDDEGDHLTRLSRSRAISMACRFGNEDCVQTSVNLYQQWRENVTQNLVHPDMQATAYCTAIAQGGQDEWYFAFDLYRNPSTSTQLKANLLTAMACSKKPWILNTYLRYSLDSNVVRSQDRETVVTEVAANPVGLPLAWDFFRANWDFFRAEYGDTVFLFDSLISGITTYFNTEFELQMVQKFMEEHPDQGTGARPFTESLAVIRGNIQWMENSYDEVDVWLEDIVNQPKVWEDIRLPQSVIPEHYDLMIRTDLEEFIFSGSVNILINITEKTSVIVLHSINLNFTEGATNLTRVSGGPVPSRTKEPWLYEPNQYVVIEFNSYLMAGEKYNLYLEFQGPLEPDLRGYYRSNYTTKGGDKRYLASTFFDPVDARKAFPCFDEPDLKATFTITLEHKEQYHALANMPKSQPDEMLEDGWVRATFEKSVVMSTYLVCYVVSDFKSVNTTTMNNVTFAVWTQEDFIDQANYALRIGADVLDHFDELYGMDIKYPISKMDMIALPDFTAGAMENWGLITYRESALLYKDGESSESQRQRVCTIIAHELAHQWFGNLVTMKWWDYLWLNEGFASYVEYVGTEEVEKELMIWDKFVVYDLQRSMATDALVTSRPVVIPVSTPSEINSMFDRISYNKGASLLRMMRYFLGNETFTKGLKYYLRARQYDTAENSDLWKYLQQAANEDKVSFGSGVDIAAIMGTWMNQMGFPTVTVTRIYSAEENKIVALFKQKRFLTDPASDTGSSNYPDLGYKWHIPLTYTTGAEPDFDTPRTMWMQPSQQMVEIQMDNLGDNTDWLLVNINQRGFYRVNYDETNWKLLARQLNNDHTVISVTSRSALISDAFNLARAGELSQSQALDITSYLTNEREYVAWYTVDGVLGYIFDNLALTPANASFESYIRTQIDPMYQYVGWTNDGDHLKKLSRARAISMACGYGLENCKNESVSRYAAWMMDMDANPVDADLQYTVFCTGIAEGGWTEWQFAFDLYTDSTTDTSLKTNLQSALACSKDVAILTTYLNAVLNASLIREQDGKDVVVAVAANPAGTDLAWDFFKDNWSFFRKAYGNAVFLFDSLILGVTTRFNTQERLDEVEQFILDHPDQGTGAWAFTQAVAEINANIRWMDQNYDEVAEWLDNAGNEAWERVRLPDTILPISYDLKVRTDLTDFVFSGSVDSLVECFEKTDIILIHSRNLTIDPSKVTLTRDGGGSVPGFSEDPWLYEPNEFLVIQLDSMLENGAKYRVYIEFEGMLLNDLQGYYWSTYTTKADEKRFLASTFFDPVDARKAFPCFDEPAMKARFTITLEHEPRYHALSNMPKILPVETLSDGWLRTTFKESVVMSTYLVCYIVSDFKNKSMATENGIEFGVWAQEDFINQTDYALEKGVAILDFFDERYGKEMNIEYPLAKMDMIALPDFTAGAMENWGLITYREARLLYEPGVSSESRKQSVCTVIAHELAHQWFGNLVTTKWWDYLWLNEGFASYVEYIGTQEVEPDWGMWDKFVIYDLHRSMGSDALATSRPIVAKTLTPSEINEMFDTITYNKGASVLRMLSDFIGEATFLKGIRYYLRTLQYSGAENADLWLHLNWAISEDGVNLGEGIDDIATIMRTWTDQMGFPTVTVTRMYSESDDTITVSATQSRFLTDPASDTSSPYPDLGYVWHIPLTYTTGANPDFDSPEYQWMRPEDKTTKFVIEDAGGDKSWLLANVNQRGFFSVNYDATNWALLSDQLENDHNVISIASRASLLYDAFSLARAGDLDQTSALDLTSYLKDERDYVPWYTVNRVMGYIGDNLALEEANDNFRSYMKNQVTPMYEFTGWADEGDHLKRLGRSTAISLACGYGNDHCVSEALRQYGEWMADPSTINVQPDLRSTVFCTAIAEGTQDDWDFAFNTYLNTSDSTIESILQSALACSNVEDNLNMYLKQVLDTSIIRSQDGQAVVSAVASNPAGRILAWDFFVDNWDFFRSTYGNGVFLFENVISAVTSDFNTPAQLKQVENFIATHPDQGTGSRAFTKSLAVIAANIRWMEQNYDDVAKWLRRVV